MPRNIIKTEPVGIVISEGRAPAATTTRLAYVWGPAPEQDIESDLVAHRAA